MKRLCVLVLLGLSACGGLAQLRTARTVPLGKIETTLSLGYNHNEMVKERGWGPNNLPTQLNIRWGLSDNVDMGARTFFYLGAIVDTKWRVYDDHRFAFAVSGGVGGAAVEATVLHVPVHVLGSWQATPWLSPYMALGYGAFWLWGYKPEHPPDLSNPLVTQAPWQAHGDGMLMAHLGLELGSPKGTAWLLEYALLRPVLDNEGDNHQFATNHLFLTGVRF